MSSEIPEHIRKQIQISVILLCGLPGSGKSTLSRSISEHYQRQTIDESSPHFHKVVQIEYDAITSRLEKDRSEEKISTSMSEATDSESFTSPELEAWRETRTEALCLLREELLLTLQQSGNSYPDASICPRREEELRLHFLPIPYKMLIIMDDNFHLRSMRRDVYKVIQTFADQLQENASVTQNQEELHHSYEEPIKIGLAMLFVNKSLEVCIVNNKQRLGTANYIPQRIITNMYQTMEIPDGQKAKFEICSMDTSETKVNTQNPDNGFFLQLGTLLSSSVSQHPVLPTPPPSMTPEEKEKERLATLQSTMHQVDLILRAFVGATCRTNKMFGKTANIARKVIIAECKQDPTLLEKFSAIGSEAVKMEFEKKVLVSASEDQSVEIKLSLSKASIEHVPFVP